jgi:hypothetical protein
MDHRKIIIAVLTFGTLLGVASITPAFAGTSSGSGDSAVNRASVNSEYGNNTRSSTANCPNHLTNPYISDGNGMYYDADGTKTPCF